MKVVPLLSILLGSAIAVNSINSAIASPDHSGSHHHHHEAVMVPENAPVPSVTLELIPDIKQGWNLQIITENFDFAPATVNQDSNINAGHAHFYINGEKITRLYGHWYYIEELPSGTHTLTVTLNTNRHEDILYEGELIQASVSVTVP
ncbi:MAG: hypothetical protein SAJ12_02400 [Jaaginema sp. PMC 1079.18]|nr:hypothetical protein [Jaaginema sp. PMC 1080.18]MEC4849840.1 hypothetical protein [Jaaginema sp. PMC 1079.18]MEC4864553.1 hypothetical protein [Jaaginema sp. PMC 1078.18]